MCGLFFLFWAPIIISKDAEKTITYAEQLHDFVYAINDTHKATETNMIIIHNSVDVKYSNFLSKQWSYRRQCAILIVFAFVLSLERLCIERKTLPHLTIFGFGMWNEWDYEQRNRAKFVEITVTVTVLLFRFTFYQNSNFHFFPRKKPAGFYARLLKSAYKLRDRIYFYDTLLSW